jgi:hypothetical protein
MSKKRSCQHKRKYESWAAADHHAGLLERRDKIEMNAYQCEFCGRWHVGHTPKRLIGKTQLYHPDIK